MTFGEKLKAARTEAGLKQSELGKKLNTTGNTISNWENNVSKPDLDTLAFICGILHVTASYFLEATLPEDEISIPELKFVKKYRFISEHSPDGKEVIDMVLDRECAIAARLKDQTKYIEKLELLNSNNDFIDPYADIPDTLEELEEQQPESSLPDIEHHAG